ncbi:LPS assembly lipoprotein LptE, partial [Methylogaea oryzae]
MTRYLLPLLIAACLAGCGFHLRGDENSPLRSTKVAILGVSTSDPLWNALTTAFGRAGATVQTSATSDSVVIQLAIAQTIRPISLNRSGIAREFDLGYNVTYEIKNAKGEILDPSQKLKISREQYNDQFLIMGRTEEETQMRLEMQEEAADTLVRRLAFLLRRHPPAEAEPAAA